VTNVVSFHKTPTLHDEKTHGNRYPLTTTYSLSDDESHTGAMIALVPSDADLDRLVIEDVGELREQLHLTLAFLGDADNWDDEARGNVVALAKLAVRGHGGSIEGDAFGIGHWNLRSDEPCWVLSIGGVEIDQLRHHLWGRLMELDETDERVPFNHRPWVAHVTIAYTDHVGLHAQMRERLGNITFDKLRVTFGGDVTDVALSHNAATLTSSGGDVIVPWHVVHNHSECPAGKPWAVVKDADGSVCPSCCHETKAQAQDQLAALYADEHASSDVVIEAFGQEPFVTDKPWNGGGGRFTDEQYRRAAAACDAGKGKTAKQQCFLPHHEPGGQLNRNGVHAAAQRSDSVRGASPEALSRAKAHLRRHYSELNEEPPDSIKTEDEVVTFDAVLDETVVNAQVAPWEGPLVIEGETTGDQREFAPKSITWVTPPLPLRWNKEDSHGGEPHTVAVNVGRIDEVWRDGDKIMGRGVLDLGGDNGREAHRLVDGGFLKGVSIDADDITDADVELIYPESGPSDGDDEEGLADILMLFARPEKIIYHAGRIRAATLCDIPAFVDAYITLIDKNEDEDETYEVEAVATEETTSLVAHAGRDWTPPRAWFEDPQFHLHVPLTVTDEGRVYGHAARWEECHIGYPGTCVTPPPEDDFIYFLTGEIICDDGSHVPVGQITMSTVHANDGYGASRSKSHYENTACAVADVTCGADAHGIWVAGAIRPTAEQARVREMRASGQLSGDWRRIGGQLRLVALLVVNVPGFPIPRTKARITNGAQLSLVAAGMISAGRVPLAEEEVTIPDVIVTTRTAAHTATDATTNVELNVGNGHPPNARELANQIAARIGRGPTS